MKIFDFSEGVKGKLLGEIKRTSYSAGWLIKKGDTVFKVELTGTHGGPDDRWSWVSAAGHMVGGEDVDINPRDFGADAICFCTGEFFHLWHAGHPEAESHWDWQVIGTKEWNRHACETGILKATKVAS